jgi:hypothetical protein
MEREQLKWRKSGGDGGFWQTAMTQAKDLKSDLLSGLNDTMLDLGKRLEKAQNENDKIYFDKVDPLTFPNLDPG